MTTSRNHKEPLISVIIPCYNHGRYLATAINSVNQQRDYTNIEIVVVDDGSKDDTRTVTEMFDGVKYVYQENAGLSAARNTGIANSTGKYLIFLDADDWLYEDAMSINAGFLINNDQVAFVSGFYEYLYEYKGESKFLGTKITGDHYQAMLERNYIGMHATVLYQRWVFDFVRYDTTLKACEDYDLYLRITREFPVIHHNHLIAVYRIHNENMSGNIKLMLDSALYVLQKQKDVLRNESEVLCYNKGLAGWKSFYVKELIRTLTAQSYQGNIDNDNLNFLKDLNKKEYQLFIARRRNYLIKKTIKKILPVLLVKLLEKKS